MKVKQSTDLNKYGFIKDQYGFWVYQVPGFTGKGKDKRTPVRFEVVVADNRDIYFYTTNDHVFAPYENADDVVDEYNMEETIDIPMVILDLFKNNELELEPLS